MEQAEVAAAALDALGLDAADLLLGASYGGMVGLALAQHFPARIRRLAASIPSEPRVVLQSRDRKEADAVGLL